MSQEGAKSGSGFTLRPSAEEGSESRHETLPRIDFSTFVLSLGASGMVQLGLVPETEGGEPSAPNLALAQQTIDTLEMLLEKTRGNLDDEETKLVQSVLYELRMGFVRAKG